MDLDEKMDDKCENLKLYYVAKAKNHFKLK